MTVILLLIFIWYAAIPLWLQITATVLSIISLTARLLFEFLSEDDEPVCYISNPVKEVENCERCCERDTK